MKKRAFICIAIVLAMCVSLFVACSVDFDDDTLVMAIGNLERELLATEETPQSYRLDSKIESYDEKGNSATIYIKWSIEDSYLITITEGDGFVTVNVPENRSAAIHYKLCATLVNEKGQIYTHEDKPLTVTVSRVAPAVEAPGGGGGENPGGGGGTTPGGGSENPGGGGSQGGSTTPSETTGKGTLESPYTVADALKVGGALANGQFTDTAVYVKGYVVAGSTSQGATPYKGGDGDWKLHISDTENGTTTFYIFFATPTSGITDVKVGDLVVVKGYIENFNSVVQMYGGSSSGLAMPTIEALTPGSGSGTTPGGGSGTTPGGGSENPGGGGSQGGGSTTPGTGGGGSQGGGEATTSTDTIDLADYASTHGWTTSTSGNEVTYTTIETNVVTISVTATANAQSTTGKATSASWWGSNWRLYSSEQATMTFTAKSGYTIVSIKITASDKDKDSTASFNVGSDTYNAGDAIPVNGSTVTMSVAGKQARITKIEITYSQGGSGTTPGGGGGTTPGGGSENPGGGGSQGGGSTTPGTGGGGSQGGGEATTSTDTIDLADYASTHGWTTSTSGNEVTYTTIETNVVTISVTATANAQSTTGKATSASWWGSNWRLYSSEQATMTFTAKSGYTIVSIKITASDKDKDSTASFNVGSDTYNAGDAIPVNGSTVTMSVAGKQARITKIEITYSQGGSTTPGGGGTTPIPGGDTSVEWKEYIGKYDLVNYDESDDALTIEIKADSIVITHGTQVETVLATDFEFYIDEEDADGELCDGFDLAWDGYDCYISIYDDGYVCFADYEDSFYYILEEYGGGSENPDPHVCEHQCPTCHGCLDETCQDPVCANNRCPGHTVTPPVEEEGFNPITQPAAGTTYKLAMKIADDQWHYVTGEFKNTYYLETLTDVAKAADVEVIADGQGWIIKIDGKFLEVISAVGTDSKTHTNVKLNDAQTDGQHWTWDETNKIFVFGTEKYILGTQKSATHDTVSATVYDNVGSNYLLYLGIYNGEIGGGSTTPGGGGSNPGGETNPGAYTFDFVGKYGTYSASWSGSVGSYTERTVSATDLGIQATVEFVFSYASKQASNATIDDRPVLASKSGTVQYLTVNGGGAKITSVTFNLKEWVTGGTGAPKKFSKLRIEYTTNGSSWVEVSDVGFEDSNGKQITDYLTLSSGTLPSGVVSVRLVYAGAMDNSNDNSNKQLGLSSIILTLA